MCYVPYSGSSIGSDRYDGWIAGEPISCTGKPRAEQASDFHRCRRPEGFAGSHTPSQGMDVERLHCRLARAGLDSAICSRRGTGAARLPKLHSPSKGTVAPADTHERGRADVLGCFEGDHHAFAVTNRDLARVGVAEVNSRRSTG